MKQPSFNLNSFQLTTREAGRGQSAATLMFVAMATPSRYLAPCFERSKYGNKKGNFECTFNPYKQLDDGSFAFKDEDTSVESECRRGIPHRGRPSGVRADYYTAAIGSGLHCAEASHRGELGQSELQIGIP